MQVCEEALKLLKNSKQRHVRDTIYNCFLRPLQGYVFWSVFRIQIRLRLLTFFPSGFGSLDFFQVAPAPVPRSQKHRAPTGSGSSSPALFITAKKILQKNRYEFKICQRRGKIFLGGHNIYLLAPWSWSSCSLTS